jgi:hypothetical protein
VSFLSVQIFQNSIACVSACVERNKSISGPGSGIRNRVGLGWLGLGLGFFYPVCLPAHLSISLTRCLYVCLYFPPRCLSFHFFYSVGLSACFVDFPFLLILGLSVCAHVFEFCIGFRLPVSVLSRFHFVDFVPALSVPLLYPYILLISLSTCFSSYPCSFS